MRSWTISDSVVERPRAMAWAAALGAYLSSAAAAMTRSRSSGLTVRSLLPLMARDAVDKETPAALATSLSVTTRGTLAANSRYLDIEILSEVTTSGERCWDGCANVGWQARKTLANELDETTEWL